MRIYLDKEVNRYNEEFGDIFRNMHLATDKTKEKFVKFMKGNKPGKGSELDTQLSQCVNDDIDFLIKELDKKKHQNQLLVSQL